MAAYFSGSNIQTEAMQTLYLMNPDYTGYADMGNPGSMLFLNHSLGNQSSNQNLPTGGHLQNPYTGIQFPSAAPPKHSSADSLERPGTSQQGVGSSLLATRLGSQGYNTWRNIGNELTFMQGADPNRHTQSLSEKIRGYSSVENHPISEIDPTDIKHTTISNPQLSINQSNIGLQLDQSQASEAHMQGLSLSLSPQQLSSMQLSCFQNQPTRSHLVHTNANGPSISEANSHENTNMLDRINNKLSGTQSSFLSRDSTPCPNILMTASSAGADRQLQSFSNAYLSTGVPNSLTGSKYFKATQELLDEIVSVGRGTKYDSGKNQKGEKKNLTTDGTANEGPMSASTCVQEIKSENPAALSPADRQELQMKKAKLVAMLDEVDRRYRQYYHQMQIVVSSFEAAAGLGSAKTYTALALKTISRHFRSLRDAIAGQIRLTSKNLGEDEFTGSGQGGTSRLHFVDQQLRQQRALQQLGMLQQHAWRPQRGLPERAVSILRAWLFEHFLHPYPKDADKHFLARQTGLTRNQVSNWFINARVRLWKPMVEEMYMEEVKEAESQASGADSKATAESDQNKAEPEAKDQGNTDNGEEDKAPKITAMKEDSNAGYSLQPETSNMTLNAGLSSANRISGGNHSLGIASLSENNNFFHSPIEEEAGLRQEGQQKRVRNLIHDSTAIMPNLMTNDVGLRTEENDYSFSNNKILQMDENGDFGSYQVQGLSRFGQDQFSGLGGVSLTLGLQHCDHLSMSRAQRPYAGEMPLSSERRSDLGVGIEQSHFQQIQNGNDVDSANDYNTLGMHNQKRYPSQLLHDFVA